MTVPSSPASEAGPSKAHPAPIRKRVAELADSSDEDDHPKGTAGQPNGHASPRKGKKMRITNGTKNKNQLEEERTKRKAEAERLLVKRQELPFYQG